MFLPGDPFLDVNITVANVNRLKMCRESSSGNIAPIVCNGSVGFSFTNMVDFNIFYSLAFTSYNRFWSHGSHTANNYALCLNNPFAKLVNCSFHDNIGTALVVNNTNITLIDNQFKDNQCECGSFPGCGITTLNSILTFTGNTTFLENREHSLEATRASAGAILAVASFNGTKNFF